MKVFGPPKKLHTYTNHDQTSWTYDWMSRDKLSPGLCSNDVRRDAGGVLVVRGAEELFFSVIIFVWTPRGQPAIQKRVFSAKENPYKRPMAKLFQLFWD